MKRDINLLEDDIGLSKRIIEKVLCEDPDIVEVIENHNIDLANSEDLMYENIFPFIRVPDVQDESKSYICYEVDDITDNPRNDRMKIQYIQFTVFVHKDLIKTKYGVPRHDVISYIIRDLFNRSRLFGHELKMIYNKGGVTDVNYYTRSLKFQLTTPEVTQDGLFDNRYERFSLNAKDKRIVRENV